MIKVKRTRRFNSERHQFSLFITGYRISVNKRHSSEQAISNSKRSILRNPRICDLFPVLHLNKLCSSSYFDFFHWQSHCQVGVLLATVFPWTRKDSDFSEIFGQLRGSGGLGCIKYCVRNSATLFNKVRLDIGLVALVEYYQR